MPDTPSPLPEFVTWPSFPFEGDLRVKPLDPPVDHEPPREGEDATPCVACTAPDDAYIWVSERWRVRALTQPSGLPMVLILESRSHLDLGDLPNMLAAELGVMTVRLERAIRSLDGVARVHVNRWGDGAAHLHLWFMARPQGQLQLRGSFLPLWDDILPPISESRWRENLALVAAWLGEFGGRSLAEPPHIDWQSPAKLSDIPTLPVTAGAEATAGAAATTETGAVAGATDSGGSAADGTGETDGDGDVPASAVTHSAPAASGDHQTRLVDDRAELVPPTQRAPEGTETERTAAPTGA